MANKRSSHGKMDGPFAILRPSGKEAGALPVRHFRWTVHGIPKATAPAKIRLTR